MDSIAPEDISVVIQGPLYRGLADGRGIESCITSIRKHLPGAEIVVSTWQDADIGGLDADVIIQSDDPGYLRDCSGNVLNTNRQLISTLAGVKATSRPYVMKFRADHNLTSRALAQIGQYNGNRAYGRLFDNPITITTLFIRDPARYPMLFHVSDLVSFGRRGDMMRFWDQKVFAYEEIFNPKPNRNPFGNFVGYSAMRMNTEQAMMLGLLRKQGINISLDHPCQIRSRDLTLWDAVLSNDFHILEWREAGVDFPGRFQNVEFSMETLYSVKSIQTMAALSATGRRLRRTRVWINQYLLNCLRLAWWVSVASIILFSTSPNLAKLARGVWRKMRRIQHPSPEKS